MAWDHFDEWQTGTVCVFIDHEVIDCEYRMGEITTGRQRVFHRFFIRLYLPDGSTILGVDQHSRRMALVHLDNMAKGRGIWLLAAGLDRRWTESGLSANTGFGYWPNLKNAVHMVELPPLGESDPENEALVDDLIGDAMGGSSRTAQAILEPR